MKPMAKGGTKSQLCCGNSAGGASASLRTSHISAFLMAIFELFEGVVGFEYIHSSFLDQKRSPDYTIFSEMKSSLILMVGFKFFEGVVGFEYIHSSFPDRKRSPENPIFSEIKSSLK